MSTHRIQMHRDRVVKQYSSWSRVELPRVRMLASSTLPWQDDGTATAAGRLPRITGMADADILTASIDLVTHAEKLGNAGTHEFTPRRGHVMITNLPTQSAAKDQAKRLRRALADLGFEIGHAKTLDLVAAVHGVRNWNTLAGLTPAAATPPSAPAGAVPILRTFDWESSRSFYLDFLGWTLDGEHEFVDHVPRYLRLIGPGSARVHLSEHHGDGTPGTAVLIEVPDVALLQSQLADRDYGYAEPAVSLSSLGRTLTVHDPAGNRITFVEPRLAAEASSPERIPDDLPPIVHEMTVGDDPSAAFARFTSFSWWRDYGLAPDGQVIIEDAEVIFRNPDGEFSIGTVTEWQTGRRYAQTFTLAQDPDYPTTLTVQFIPQGDGTLVRLEHGGWNATNADRRGHFTDWPIILAHFRRLSSRRSRR